MRTALAILVAILVVGYCYLTYQRWSRPSNDAFVVLPRVGFPRGPFKDLRSMFVAKNLKDAAHNAYVKYGKTGNAFVASAFLWSPRVVLPPSLMPWIQSQPEDVLSFDAAVRRTLAFESTTLDPLVMDRSSHPAVVRGPLTRSLAWTPDIILKEVQQSFTQVWGQPTDWTNVKLFDTLLTIQTRVTLRIFLSLESEINDDLLAAAVDYSNSLAIWGTLLRPIPETTRIRFSWPLLFFHRRQFRKLYKHIAPLIEQRKSKVLDLADGSQMKAETSEDLLYWLVQSARSMQDAREWSTIMIAKRFSVVLFASLHTTTWTMTNLFLDLVSADRSFNLLETLRDESHKIATVNEGSWSKADVASLLHADSALRESMRLRTMTPWAMHRVVASKGGVTLPNGVHVPQHTSIMVSAHEIMRDDDNYPDGAKFNPFRFSYGRYQAQPNKSKQQVDSTADKKPQGAVLASPVRAQSLDAVTVDTTFLPFGSGKHACPGRFFVSQQIKLVLVHVLSSYEIALMDERPPEIWLGTEKMPDVKSELKIRVRG